MKKAKLYILSTLLLLPTLAYAASYDDVVSDMEAIVETYPEYASIISIGKNDQRDEIYGLKIENPSSGVFARLRVSKSFCAIIF